MALLPPCLHPLVTLPFFPQLPCPHCVSQSLWGAQFSPVTLQRHKGLHPCTTDQPAERKRILTMFAQRILVCGRKGRVALFLMQAGCQLCREMVRAMVLCWAASETHCEPQEQKTRSPCSSLTWQLVCPGLHGCFLLAGPARSGMACVTHL